MLRDILIVSVTQTAYRQIKKACQDAFGNRFSFMLAPNTKAAADQIREHSISMVILDSLPKNERVANLLFYIWNAFPDIPVFNMAGAQAFPDSLMAGEKRVTIPFSGTLPQPKWPQIIHQTMNRHQEGGFLRVNNVSNFAQMVQNDQRTCTLRIIDHTGGRLGVLLFEKGELKNARLKTAQGDIAACEILHWEKAKVYIQNSCYISLAKIQSTLEALLIRGQAEKDQREELPSSSPSWTMATQQEKQSYQKLLEAISSPPGTAGKNKPRTLSAPAKSIVAQMLSRPMVQIGGLGLVLLLIITYLAYPLVKHRRFKHPSHPPAATISSDLSIPNKPLPDIKAPVPEKQENNALKILPPPSSTNSQPARNPMAPASTSPNEKTSPRQARIKSNTVSKPRPYSVYLHYTHSENRLIAHQLAEYLKAEHIVVPMIEQVAVPRNDIRYFHTADRDYALDLELRIIRFLKEHFPQNSQATFRIKNMAAAYPKAPRDQLELWLNLPIR